MSSVQSLPAWWSTWASFDDHGDDIDDDVGSQEEVDNHHPHSASVIKLGAHLI